MLAVTTVAAEAINMTSAALVTELLINDIFKSASTLFNF